MSFIVGSEHADIFAALENSQKNILISALAGTGKSTTAIEMMRRAKTKNIAIMAFNRDIKTELEMKVPDGVFVSTLNGFGFRSFPRGHGRQLNALKSSFILQDVMAVDRYDSAYLQFQAPVRQLVGLAKGQGYRASDGNIISQLHDLVERHSIDAPEIGSRQQVDRMIGLAKLVLAESENHPRYIDFDDQLWLPVIHGWPIQKFDLLFVDEAQDLNPIQQELISRAITKDGRIVIIGDENQAIYGFRGADCDSMRTMRKRFDADCFPLSTTWRCATEIVDLAKEIVPNFTAASNAPRGEVVRFSDISEIEFDPSDMIICRTNAPLLRAALALLRRQIPFDFLGRDLGKNLIATVKKANGKSNKNIDVFLKKLDEYAAKKSIEAKEKENEEAAQNAYDTAESIKIFAENSSTVNDLIDGIAAFFTKKFFEKEKIKICTIHKSKGLEADRVFILDFDKMPARWAKKQEDKRQERNLKYVAITRAKTTLGLVGSGKNKKKSFSQGEHAEQLESKIEISGQSIRIISKDLGNFVDVATIESGTKQ